MSDAHACGIWGCAKHALMERTCCQASEVFVTEGDKRRIAEHTGLEDFWENRAPENPEYLAHEDDSVWGTCAFRPDGTRPILKRRPEGDCVFLGAQGCTLPGEVRPLVCRLYPFDYTDKGIHGVGGRCPSYVVPPGSTLLEVLGMNREGAARWHAILYRELRVARRTHV